MPRAKKARLLGGEIEFTIEISERRWASAGGHRIDQAEMHLELTTPEQRQILRRASTRIAIYGELRANNRDQLDEIVKDVLRGKPCAVRGAYRNKGGR
jgi:hypothetical protein